MSRWGSDMGSRLGRVMPLWAWVPAYVVLFALVVWMALVGLPGIGWWGPVMVWYYAVLFLALVFRHDHATHV